MTVATVQNIGSNYFDPINTASAADHFRLSDSFIKQFKNKRPQFGFCGLGEFVFYRTYSRIMENGAKETFLDTLRRVVEGCYEIQQRHCRKMHIPWDYEKAVPSAEEMFTRMWEFKFLPPGRGLWMMGTKFMWERGSSALNNCGFVSTKDITADPAEPFCFLMDMSMLGVGIGFDAKGADSLYINRPVAKRYTYTINDSREGWCGSLRALIESYTIKPQNGEVDFDYSLIRPAGSTINGFGGKASGPGILQTLHGMVRELLDKRVGCYLSSVDIVDIMNYIGRCVVAGNVRRTAEIAFGEPNDASYTQMKNPLASFSTDRNIDLFKLVSAVTSKIGDTLGLEHFSVEYINKIYDIMGVENNNGHSFHGLSDSDTKEFAQAIETYHAMNSHRWASNNSIFGYVGMDYDHIGQQIAVNGEPGLIWLDNIRDYGRMIDGKQPGIDGRVMGTNPCCEQSLESYELCCLVESFPANHIDAADYMRTLKFAYLYAKTVTLLPTHNPRTNAVTMRNRRIGLSQSGIVQAFSKFGRRAILRDFCDAGYNEIRRWDDIYSNWLCIPKSIKVTSIKPSGTVSLVAGATPGIHHPEASTYWRRVRIAADSILVRLFRDAGYHVEQSVTDERTMVVKFGVTDERVRPVNEISIWEQMANAIDYQRYWADNQVSCTVKFKPEEAGEIAKVLEVYEDQMKGISFLPWSGHGYAQAPYEPCTEAEVLEYNSKIRDIDFTDYIYEGVGSHYCDGDKCEVN